MIQNLAFNNDENKAAVVAGGGVQLAAAAMKRFATDVEMQKSAFWAFSNMSKNDEHDNSEDMVNDVIDVVLSAMERFQDIDTTVLEGACITLRNLAMDDVSSAAIAARGGITACARAMTQYPDDSKLQEAAVGAVANIVWNIPEHVAMAQVRKKERRREEEIFSLKPF